MRGWSFSRVLSEKLWEWFCLHCLGRKPLSFFIWLFFIDRHWSFTMLQNLNILKIFRNLQISKNWKSWMSQIQSWQSNVFLDFVWIFKVNVWFSIHVMAIAAEKWGFLEVGNQLSFQISADFASQQNHSQKKKRDRRFSYQGRNQKKDINLIVCSFGLLL